YGAREDAECQLGVAERATGEIVVAQHRALAVLAMAVEPELMRAQHVLEFLDGELVEVPALDILDRSAGEERAVEDGAADVDAAQLGSLELGGRENRAAQARAAEIGTAEIRVLQHGAGDIGVAQIGAAESGVGEIGVGQIGANEGGAREVGAGEIAIMRLD